MENLTLIEKRKIEEFREYLSIDTRQPHPDYSTAIIFLKDKCESIGFTCQIKEYVSGKPILIATLLYKDNDNRKSLLLNSHVDVVPTVDEQWTFPPMSAAIKDGKIYARGSQDMKSVGMAYIHALENIEKNRIKRTIHLTFVPDEEIGGEDGMKLLVDDKDFWEWMNVGIALDEGIPSPFTDKYFLFNRERGIIWLEILVKGPAGHGSLLNSGTAAEKLTDLLYKLNFFRQEQIKKLAKEDGRLGNVTSINVTNINSNSIQCNVVPSGFFVRIDVRVGPDFENEAKFLEFFKKNFIEESHMELNTTLRYDCLDKISKDPEYLRVIQDSIKPSVAEVNIFPGGTDSKYIRERGINAFGISLFKNTPILAHDHNEYLSIEEYLNGVELYSKVIEKLVN